MRLIQARGNSSAIVRLTLAALVAAAIGGGCMPRPGWEQLIEGEIGLRHFAQRGGGKWLAKDDSITVGPDGHGPAFLIARQHFHHFEVELDYWASDNAIGSLLLRCHDTLRLDAANCYEVPLTGKHAGAVTGIATADMHGSTGGRWNTIAVRMFDQRLVVVLNGQRVVDTHDAQLDSGYLALRWERGAMRFKRLEFNRLFHGRPAH